VDRLSLCRGRQLARAGSQLGPAGSCRAARC